MIRISNIRLPLDHPDEALAERISKKLKVAPEEILSTRLFKRSVDARDQDDIKLVYAVDVEVGRAAVHRGLGAEEDDGRCIIPSDIVSG